LFAFEEKADKNFHWDHLKCNAEWFVIGDELL
jgi:ketosteroid isomerase-like protein